MSGYLLKFKQTYSVKIGGRRYPVVKIGNQLWMAENLDWKWDGLQLGKGGTSTSVARANYYDNDESTYGWNGRKVGLLYNGVAVEYLANNPSLLNGFHVATKAEYESLIATVGGFDKVATSKLKAKDLDYAPSWRGTDDYGLSIVPSGYYNGRFGNGTIETHIWTSTRSSSSDLYMLDMDSSMGFGWNAFNHQYVVRLVKSLT